MPVTSIEKANLDSIKANAPKMFGKAKLVFLDPKDNLIFVTPKLTQIWNIRPTSDDGADKFSLEVKVGEIVDTFKNGVIAFDQNVRKLAFANKKAWFGKEADDITTENDLRMKHTQSIKKGNDKQDGTKWDDSMKFKVTGWSSQVGEIVYRGDGDAKMPFDVKWNSRPVDAQGGGGPDDNQTKFYICEGIDMTTGKEKMAPWTPCVDPAGNQIKDAHGNTKWEFVGPKHCQPGCEVRIVFHASMVWIASKFGVTLSARQVFITPPPPKTKNAVEGIEIVETVDPIMASRAAKQAVNRDDILSGQNALEADDVDETDSQFVQGIVGVGDLDAADKSDKANKSDKADKVDKSDKLDKSEKIDKTDSEKPKKKKVKLTSSEEF
jgi:hypothetical protein